MRTEDRDLVVQLCTARSGQQLDPSKDYAIENRLAPVARREGFDGVSDLIQALRQSRDDKLAWAIVEAMAAGDTSFFRDRQPFELFRHEIAADLVRQRAGHPVRIWSAACATGQEIHSLAMIVDEIGGQWPGARFELFGSDLSERALEKAQSGLYTQFEVQRGLPIRSLVRHFEKVDDAWHVAPRLRQAIRWRRLNLIGDMSRVRGFDLIFCRYVLSAMTPAAQARVTQNLAEALNPGGMVVFGLNEGPGVDGLFDPVAQGAGVYRLDPRARAAA
ncbi:MAG TPA: protein-glutamate O-methyltransferase CheR [Phenylobacterium sp.]|nr:protein-glutamate O-methyltransferase CheR [Phenylobacterium sp.]